jgi:hypothetical protein
MPIRSDESFEKNFGKQDDAVQHPNGADAPAGSCRHVTEARGSFGALGGFDTPIVFRLPKRDRMTNGAILGRVFDLICCCTGAAFSESNDRGRPSPAPEPVAGWCDGRSSGWFVSARSAPQRHKRNGLHRRCAERRPIRRAMLSRDVHSRCVPRVSTGVSSERREGGSRDQSGKTPAGARPDRRVSLSRPNLRVRRVPECGQCSSRMLAVDPFSVSDGGRNRLSRRTRCPRESAARDPLRDVLRQELVPCDDPVSKRALDVRMVLQMISV